MTPGRAGRERDREARGRETRAFPFFVRQVGNRPMAEPGAVDGTLQLFGTFRIWAAIIIGSLIAILSIVVFVMSFTMSRNFDKTEATIDRVECSAPKQVSHCSGSKNSQTCTTSTEVDCNLGLSFVPAGSRSLEKTSLRQTYDENHVPKEGSSMVVYVNRENYDDVKASIITEKQRGFIRIGAGFVFVICVVTVVVNVVFRKNAYFKRLQGGIGVIDTVGGAFSQ